MNIGILKSAHYLPQHVHTNQECCKSIKNITPDWIIEKTGIKRRFYARPDEGTGYMACKVAEKLVKDISRKDVGLIIIASYGQDYMFPALSALIHSHIKASRDCQIIDINVNCVGLVTASTIAVERMKANKSIKYALVIGTEVLSKYVNPTDKFTTPFFSDGASGILLGKVPTKQGYVNSFFCTDSSVYEEVKLERGGVIYQNGKATWNQVMTNIPYTIRKLVHNTHMIVEDVDFLIFHQANKVLIDYIMEKLRIPLDKTFTNVEEIGNTGAASIGIAFDEAMTNGLINPGDLVMFIGVGAGFNFGANLWKM